MPRPTSRLERNERKKILKQTYYFLGGAAVIGLLFVFLVIPNFIRILNAVFAGEMAVIEDRIPPQVPLISAPADATTSSNLEITGFGEPESTIFVLLNGQESAQVETAQDGVFTVSIQLSDGENTFAAYSKDAAGNDSEISKTFRIVLDSEPPILDVISPEEASRVEGARNQTITVVGSTDPDAKIYLNERVIFPREDGSFSGSFYLSEGENKLQFKSIDQAGNETTVERLVTFVR